mmetsp:Transcript_18369/g.53131  ORF Transcript_18369/g.53131 Transcript_18369/m.53131 type:complete len:225 (+) Transcript_18369:187-861(+)
MCRPLAPCSFTAAASRLRSRSQSHQPSHGRPLPSARAAFYHQSSLTPPSNASTLIPRACLPARRRTIAPSHPPRYAVLTAVWSAMAFDPEGEVAYYHEPHEAGRPNYAVLGPTGFDDRGSFYGGSRNSSVGSPPLRACSRLRRSRRTLPRPMRFAQSKRDGFATMAMAASSRAREPIRTGSSIGCAISSLAIDATARIRRGTTRADMRARESTVQFDPQEAERV